MAHCFHDRMSGRQRMLTTLAFREPDRPPHFESMFELEHEAFGLRFPERHTWASMTPRAKEAAIDGCMAIYARIIEEFRWDALAVYWPWGDADGVRAAVRHFGRDILIGGMVGRGVWSIEAIDDWLGFACALAERPAEIREEAKRMCRKALESIDRLCEAGCDFIYMPNDIAFNAGPFISPPQLAEFVMPYWRRQVERVKQHGRLAFIHTDGQVMPILDQMIALGADCFQSVDPMAGMDIATVKAATYGKLALMGNVQCSLLQDGPAAAIRASARYCLEHAAPGGGYIFGTSNTIFPGMPLANYRIMLDAYWDYVASRPAATPRTDRGPCSQTTAEVDT